MNNILGYYLMPHPPIIIPEVGRGEEKKAIKSIKACQEIGEEVTKSSPETIIIITPHGPLFKDAITISYSEAIFGTLANFRAREVQLEMKIDVELTEGIYTLASNKSIPVLKTNSEVLEQYGLPYTLDHGSIVPLSFIKGDYKLVHITYGMLDKYDLFNFGTMILEATGRLNRKAVVIASGDLSHRVTKESPYQYSPSGKAFDDLLVELLIRGDSASIFNMDLKLIKNASECGLRSLYILLGTINHAFKGKLLSYEAPFGIGYGVMKFIVKEIKDKVTNDYCRLARGSIEYYFKYKNYMEVPDDIGWELVNKKAGVFVSLKKYGKLRGCIGTFLPTMKNIASEIIRLAVAAAIDDPRFPPLNDDELDDVDISVDVLSTPESALKEELNPKTFGVIVRQGYRRGLLLPDLEGINTIEEQLFIACKKAGINPDSEYEIEKFTVTRFTEDDNGNS